MAIAKIKTAKTGVFWRHKILSLVILFAIIIVGYLAYIRVQAANNKRDFQQARAAIDSIYDDILRSVGKPDSATISSQCLKQHQEFSEGNLVCNTGDTIVYGVDNIDEANTYLNRVEKIINENSFIANSPAAHSLRTTSAADRIYYTASSNYKFKTLNCTASYTYNPGRSTTQGNNDNSGIIFEITFGCYGPAKQQYYRLAS